MVGEGFECQPIDGPFAITKASLVLNVLGGGFEAPHDGVPTISLGSAPTWAGVRATRTVRRDRPAEGPRGQSPSDMHTGHHEVLVARVADIEQPRFVE